MNTSGWIEYTGSDEQIEEIDSSDNDALFKLETGRIMRESEVNDYWWLGKSTGITHYLICDPHPYADEIKIWADTGCEVWIRSSNLCYEDNKSNVWERFGLYVTSTTKPNWNIPGAEYRLTPFED